MYYKSYKSFLFPLSFCLSFWTAHLSVYAQSALADVHTIDKWTESCVDKDASAFGLSECYYQAYEKWDNELNSVYKALISRLNPEQKERLKKSQRRWLDYRDEEFEVIRALYSTLEGVISIPAAQLAKMQVVKHRTLSLKSYLDTLTAGKKQPPPEEKRDEGKDKE